MSAAAVAGEMSLAPIISSPPGGDHHSHHHQPLSALSTVESYDNADQAALATVPRALALNDEDILSCSSPHSSLVTANGSSISITPTTPTAPAGSSSPTAETAATLTPTRPTGRVVLQALKTTPGGAATSAHLGGTAASGVYSKDNDSNKQLSPSRLPPTEAAEEVSGAFKMETQLSLHGVAGDCGGSTGPTGEACRGAVSSKTVSDKSDDDRGENDGDSSPETLLTPPPLALPVSPGNSGAAADCAELLSDASTKPQGSMTGAGGRPTIIRSPSGGIVPVHRSFAGLSSIPSFFQRAESKASIWGADAREQSSKKWSMMYSAQSCKTVDYEDDPLGLDGYDSERARRNWRVLRAVFMALGKATQARIEKGPPRVVFVGSVREEGGGR